MQHSVSNQRSERTASASNCFYNTPVSKVKISLKPAFQVILRYFLLSYKTSYTSFWNYVNKLWRHRFKRVVGKNQNSWVVRQDSSMQLGQLSIPSSKVWPWLEGKNRQGESVSLLRLKIPKTNSCYRFSITILCASELFLSMSMGGKSKIEDLK